MTMINGRYRLMKKVERYSSPLQSTRVHTCASFQGRLVRERACTKEMSELLIKPLTVTSPRKLLTVTDCPDCAWVTYDRQSTSKASARALPSCSRVIYR